MKVTIIGVGGLGGALAEGLLRAFPTDSGVTLTLCARRPGALNAFAHRARVLLDAPTAVAGADVVVLAVKPKGTPELLAHVRDGLSSDTVVVSCAAGVSLATLAAQGHDAVARAMPNIGAQRRMSTTALCLGPGCKRDRDLPRLRRVFEAIGDVREIVDEHLLHAVTAIGASGPAFLLLAVEALVDAGVEQGLSRAESLAWARGALTAAAARLDEGQEPQAVRTQVTSPAGTTAAGLAILEDRGVRAAFLGAVRAACGRSEKLAS